MSGAREPMRSEPKDLYGNCYYEYVHVPGSLLYKLILGLVSFVT